ncbi:hypothetical protein [Spirochaeta africana]|uniref:Archaeal/vacuolar-type H+-ATPase subunit E n=1 Tax=Spirochaeta africana (strain ATCC 700263 / DSM 8902 / Z-7692) TaxID=889378 RepID=H9UJL2_SPIAZ|nr:hypothetical protein [Spirochaeta africana]AFG37705.1 hypothetical protein Spiaf_1647 [Spirochaeta africana DSM 8902]
MDIQLKELIDKIKQDGVSTAEAQAQQIASDAEAKARQIVEQAQAEAARIKQSAQAEADKFTQAGTAAVQQAARDVLLQTQNKLEKIFAAVVNDQVNEAFTPQILEKAVVSLMQNWQGRPVEDLSLQIADDQYAKAEAPLKKALADHVKRGLTVQPSDKVSAGFRIGEKDGSSFYEISADSLGELLASRVNAALGEIIKNAAAQA